MSQTCDGNAVLSYGAYLEAQDPLTQQWLDVGGLTGFNGPQITRGEIDATKLCSKAKEYKFDLKDNGTLTGTLQTMLGNPGQKLLFSNLDSTDALNFRLVLPDDGYGNGEVTITFKASVTGFPISGQPGQLITTELSLRITGDIVFDVPGAGQKFLSMVQTMLAESAENDGSVSGVVSIVVHGDTFAGTDGAALAGVTFANVPDGLTASAQKINDTTAIINFSGAATDHAEGVRAEVGVVFDDAAFTTGPAADIIGSSNRQITIAFT